MGAPRCSWVTKMSHESLVMTTFIFQIYLVNVLSPSDEIERFQIAPRSFQLNRATKLTTILTNEYAEYFELAAKGLLL